MPRKKEFRKDINQDPAASQFLVPSPRKTAGDNSAMESAIKALSKKIDEMQGSLVKVHVELKDIRSELDNIKDLKESIHFTQTELDEIKTKFVTLQNQVELKANENTELTQRLLLAEKKNQLTEERLIQLECYIRRENLKFTGIPEDQNESNYGTEKKIREIVVKKLEIEHGYEIEFQRCHRLNVKSDTKSRDIIVRFLWFQDREQVWKNKYKLKSTNIIMKEDFPMEVENRRSRLYQIMKAAKKNNHKAKMIADKLIIDGVQYKVDTLDKLPTHLQPANLATKISEKAILFYGKDSYLSNFFPAPFILDGKTFLCSEQYFQYEKAVRASDGEAAGKILTSTEPVYQMHLGRKVKVTEEQWNDVIAEKTMEVALKAKFNQNPELKKKLLNTGTRLIVECNVRDKFWGNGLRLLDANAAERPKWKGQNKMGTLLGQLREYFK